MGIFGTVTKALETIAASTKDAEEAIAARGTDQPGPHRGHQPGGRPLGTMSGATPQRVTLTLTVDVDPVAYGFDLPAAEAVEIVLRAVNAAPGLEADERTAVADPQHYKP